MTTPTFIRILLAIFISTLLPLRGGAANPAFVPQTQPADGIAGDQAVLHGVIGLNGKAGHVAFQVRKAGKKRYVGHTPWQKIARGQTNVSFSAMVSKLLPETDYEFRVVALVGGVKRLGNQLTFHTVLFPIAITLDATSVTSSNAVLNGIMNPNSPSATARAQFEWGTTTNYGNIADDYIEGSGTNDHPFSSGVPGYFLNPGGPDHPPAFEPREPLVPNTIYHFRVVAFYASPLRHSYGADRTFRTLSVAPYAITLPAGDVTSISATLNASANPNYSPTTVSFHWGTTTNYGNVTPPENISSGSNAVVVQSTLNGLVPGTIYHFRAIATNQGGVSTGADLTFVTPCIGGTNVAIVTNCTEGDLRTAIASADVIQFACDGLITLTAPIDVTCSLKLDASGHAVTLSGGNSNRLFNVGPGANLQLINLFLANGQLQGTNSTDPGVFPFGVAGAGQSVEGGGILLSNATLYAEGCVFTNCTAIGGHGFQAESSRSSGSGGNAVGGAISAHNSAVLLTNCVLSGNRSLAGLSGESGIHVRQAHYAHGRGAALAAQESVVSIANCTFSDNYATSRGGAIEAPLSDTKIAHSIFAGNSVGVAAPRSVGRFDAQGGAIAMSDGQMIVTSSAFNRNSSVGSGGALAILAGIAKISGCEFSTNVARGDNGAITLGAGFPQSALNGSGGGVTVLGGQLTIENSGFDGNQALGGDGTVASFGMGPAFAGSGLGGALYSQALLAVTNCTFGFNIAASGGPTPLAINRGGNGGAVASVGGIVTIASSTMAGNSVNDPNTNASFGGAVYRSLGGLAVLNSILAFNSVNTNANSNVAGDIADLGNNISSDSSANFTAAGSLNNTDPLLGPLGNYGGVSLTFPLLPGSPAIDAADTASSPATDQRGVTRPQGPAPDIGAFERQ